jgi:serine/threonine protein kinase
MGLSTMSTSFYLGDALVGDEKSESSLRYYLEYVVLAEKTESQAHLVKKAIMAMASILTKLGGNDGYVDESYLKFVVERLEDKERARMLKLARTWPGSRVSPPSVVSKRKGHHVSGTASGSSTSILTGEALEMANKEALRHEQELYNWDDTSRAKNQKGRFNRGNVTNQQKATQSGKKKKIKKKKGKPKEKGDRMVGQDLDTRSETKTDVAVTETNNGHLAGLEDARVVDEAVKIVEVDLESDGESNDAVADGYEDQIANNEEHDVKGKDDESEEDGKEDDVESGNENAHISWDDVPRYDHSLAWKVIGREGRYIEENKVKERVVPKWNLGFDHAVAVVERRGGNETIGVEDEVTNGAERVGDLVIYNGSLLGRGASATVTKGKHLEREVAVKCFFVRDEKTRKLVEAETNALKIGDAHQNVVRFFGCVRKDVRVFLILELCEVDLERFVTNDGGTWNHHTLFGNWIVVVKQICKGVSFLHEENVLHRDLKPGNILVHKSNLVKICDFGLAKHVASEMSTVKEIGTKGWRAPEVVLSDQRTKAADVFSTGLICYYVFAGGVHPFGPSPEMREDNIRKRKVSFPPLPDLLQQHFVKMLLEFEVVDRAFMGSRLLQHPLFRSLLGRLTFLTTLFHNSNKSLLRSQSSPAWNEAVDRSLWNRIKSAYRDDLECQLYFVRTLEQHFSDGTDVARVFEKLLNKERGKVTQEDVMQYVQRVFPTLLGRCFSLAWTHNLLK